MITQLNRNLHVFRDDIYPFLGGGNKGRKMVSISKEVKKGGCNAVVTTGGVQSNHCRAAAVVAAENRWKCTLILHGSEKRFLEESGNAKIMRLAGVSVKFVEPRDIGIAMDAAMEEYRSMGYKPYYIWGGGHTIEGGGAYIEAIGELQKYCEQNKWLPDYIFLASGTGSTQSGIMAGLDKYGINAKVYGISIARKSEVAEKIVYDFYKELCNHFHITPIRDQAIVCDDYLFGGYEKYNEELELLSDNSIKDYGFILDKTYSGKAFLGMKDVISKERIKGNVLFWHTGGIMNCLG